MRIRLPLLLPTLTGCSNGTHQRARASARLRLDTSRTRCTHCISPARRVRLTDEADRATASCSQYAIHPMRGATPDAGRYTRSEEVQCPRIGCSAQCNKHFLGGALSTDSTFAHLLHSPWIPAAIGLTVTLSHRHTQHLYQHITDKILRVIPTIDSSAELLTTFPLRRYGDGALEFSALAYAILQP